MKLDLTHDQRNALESAADVIADLIEEKLQAKDDLLDKVYATYIPQHSAYLQEQIAELKSDIRELVGCKHSMKSLTN